ncbi:MAG: hypothetical protein NTX65_02675 [Ignavibacteriales bacterium]|nr:hypothetical protein [Ignavibacteriales bacterium]
MINLDQALDSARQLSLADKEMLIEILKKQTIEERRKEIAAEVRESKNLYNTGKLTPSDSKQIIDKLHNSLSEPDNN